MRKVIVLLVAMSLIILSSACSTQDNVKSENIKRYDNIQQSDEIIKEQEIEYDYYYTKSENIVLKDEKGEKIRSLNLHERVGILNEKDSTCYVLDARNNKGYVNKSDLIKSFEQDIPKPYDDVKYGSFDLKKNSYEKLKYIKGIYVPISDINNIDSVLKSIENTEINAIIIDYKADSGNILFDSTVASDVLPEANTVMVSDGKEFIKKLKDKDLYVIARIVVFNSPIYAKEYPDSLITNSAGNPYYYNEMTWISPHDRTFWEYIYALSAEAIDYGFDEVQYDVVRFPEITEGGVDLKNKNDESMVSTIQKFLIGAKIQLYEKDSMLSVNVVGWTTTAIDDLDIGQQWESISNVVDVISPKIYPSHYASGTYDLEKPSSNPYFVVSSAAEDAKDRNANLKTPALIRPWIQDFSNGDKYGKKEVGLQIKALKDQGIIGFMMFNPKGDYHLNVLTSR